MERQISCVHYKCYAMKPLRRQSSNYFLFMTSTYRDLAGFLAPRAPDAGRPANNASSGSTFCGGVGNADDAGLEGGNADEVGIVVGGVAVAAGADTDGVRAAGGVMVAEAEATGVDGVTTLGMGGVAVEGGFATALFGGGGGGAAFAGTSPA